MDLGKVGLKYGRSIFLALLLVLSSLAQAADTRCESLVVELKAMQKAQHQLLESFSAKNEMASETLDQQAAKFEKILAASHQIKKTDLRNLRSSSGAFRAHGSREAQLIGRFEKASDQLLGQVQICLSSKGDLAAAE